MAIVHPVAFAYKFTADTAKLLEITMNVRNGVDESKRVMVVTRIWDNVRGKGTPLVDPELTGGANI